MRRVNRYWLHTGFLYMILLLCVYAILHDLPRALDDVGFNSVHYESNLEFLQYVLRYGNGRFFGNGGIIFLMHHALLADLIRSAVIAGIAMLLPKVLGLQEPMMPLLSLLLLLSISPGVFGQAFSWMSGFQNYVPPILLLFVELLMIRSSIRGSKWQRGCRYMLIFILGVCMQFYIEHTSCLNVLVAAVLVFLFHKWRDGRRPAAVLFLVSSAIGMGLMFLPTLLAARGVYQQSYFQGGIIALAKGVVRNAVLILDMYTENAIALSILAIFVCLLVFQNSAIFQKRRKYLLCCGVAIPALIFIVSLIFGLSPWYGKLAIAESALLTVSLVVYFVCAMTVLVETAKKTSSRNVTGATVMVGMAIISLLPLLLVWPIGYRCLFHSSIMLFGAVLFLAEKEMGQLQQKFSSTILSTCCAGLLATTVLCQCMIFSDIRRMVAIRDDYLKEAASQGAETVAYFTVPSPYIHEVWNEANEHYVTIDGHRMRLDIYPADVWFRFFYYHYS